MEIDVSPETELVDDATRYRGPFSESDESGGPNMSNASACSVRAKESTRQSNNKKVSFALR